MSERERILGRIRGEEPGPTLICVGGLHGNEPAGVLALERVLAGLRSAPVEVRGELAALAGNRAALAAGRRFISADLNRAWQTDRVAILRNGGPGDESREDIELVELLSVIENVAEEARGEVYVLDLHTTSGPGGLFTTVADTLANRAFAMHIPVPLVLGLEELVEGTMLEYMGKRGYVTAVFEGGQHDDPESIDRLEAGLWIVLSAIGLVSGMEGRASEGDKLLRREARGLPRAVEMKHRYHIEGHERFEMRPGYRSFDVVEEGEILASDYRGDVRSPSGARLLMPLYQEQGEDGFFLVRPFSTLWLGLSRVLRGMRFDRFVHWLPGVRRDPDRPGALVANRGVARFYALEIFHLLGYRKRLEDGKRLVVVRRESEVTGGAL